MLAYWVGRREAIEQVARSRASLWFGLFFVLTAGIAREYDQEYLFENPLAFLAPLLLSLVLSFVLYLIFLLAILRKGKSADGAKRGGYRSFLNLFWMTAPMAWLYAFPAEALFDPVTAVIVNVALLSTVSIWRVAVLTRALAVLTGRSFYPFLFWILLIGDALVLLGSVYLSISLVGIMGGIVHSPAQRVLVNINNFVGAGAFYLLLPLLIALTVSMVRGRKAPVRALPPCDRKEKLPWKTLIVLAVFALAVLGFGQRRMARHHAVEALYGQGDYAGVAAYLSARSPADFSPARPLPPAQLSTYFSGGLTGMLSVLDGTEPAWIRDLYMERLAWMTGDRTTWQYGMQAATWVPALEGFPEGRRWLEDHHDEVQEVLDGLSPEHFQEEAHRDLPAALERTGFTLPKADTQSP